MTHPGVQLQPPIALLSDALASGSFALAPLALERRALEGRALVRLALGRLALAIVPALVLGTACELPQSERATALTLVSEDPPDTPLRSATPAQRDRFAEGDATFDLPLRPSDGLGPVFIRTSCAACHASGMRGPGTVTKMVQLDPAGRLVEGQPSLPYGHTERPQALPGATPLLRPNGPQLFVSERAGVPIVGRGYVEAVADTEIERIEALQRASAAAGGPVSGRIHRVTFASNANPGQPYHRHERGTGGLIGRFGLKARIATLDDFTADAAQGDMGLTSPLRDHELPNPDGALDDAKPGLDLDFDFINRVADYMRLTELPARRPQPASAAALFDASGCAACHVPALRTRSDYPIAALANVDAPIYSDLLLHDLGPSLSDGLADADAAPSEWKTAPLVGLRFLRRFLHDGRATSVEEAIVLHGAAGSEAADSVARFQALEAADRALLLDFVSSL